MTSPELISYSTENFSSKIRKKTRIPIITTFIQHSPSHSNHTVKEIKSIQTGKEIKSSLFTYDMKENPNVSTKKTVRTNK